MINYDYGIIFSRILTSVGVIFIEETFADQLDQYAQLITKVGANVQPGQTIILYADVSQARLAELISSWAYKLKANEVIVKWNDSKIQRQFLKHTSETRLQEAYKFERIAAQELMDKHASRISLLSDSPDVFSEVEPARINQYQKTYSKVKKPVTKATMNNDISWLVVAAAGADWAKMLYPELSSEKAVAKLWQAIFTATRINTPDPEKIWKEHVSDLSNRADWLNQQQFDSLHYQSAKTDITVGLPKGHVWEGAGSTDLAGNFFVPNIPTEEVFTAPDSRRINGTVSATLPLSNNGQLIKDIKLMFKDGQVISAQASSGEELLKHLINTDDGASSLGEVALVPESSPISQMKTIFYNTLFDENASDHMALGAGYPFSIKDGTKKTRTELASLGLNDSQIHVDFMIGSADMNITGIKANGEEVSIMTNGEWTE